MTPSRLFRQPIVYVLFSLFFVAACAHKPRGLAGTSTKVDSANRAARPILLFEEFFLPSELHLFDHIKGARKLLDARMVVGQPWAPDGRAFLFNDESSYRAESVENYLTVFDLRSGETYEIALLARPYSAFWSPNGRYLFYTLGTTVEPPLQLVLYDFMTKENHILTEVLNESVYFYLAGWSHDSQKVGFITKLNGQFDAYSLQIDTLEMRQVTDDPEIELHMQWSQTENEILVGKSNETEEWVLFSTDLRSINELEFVMADGQAEPRRLANFTYANSLDWSPDGQTIAYTNLNDGLCLLHVTEETVACPEIATLSADDYSFTIHSWSSDSAELAIRYSKRHEVACWALGIVNMATLDVMDGSTLSCHNGLAYWNP